MSTLSQAPLVEVIFELRWGQTKGGDGQPDVSLEYGENDLRFFPGQFRKAVLDAGFTSAERLNPNEPPLPFRVSDRFRRSPTTWPCYQIGLGIFTANQINAEYDWEPFKATVLSGLELLDSGHPSGLASLPVLHIELRYIDGLVFGENEKPMEFIKNKLQIAFEPPRSLTTLAEVEPEPSSTQLAFSLTSKKPKGVLQFDLKRGTINGQDGFAATTIVRSVREDCPTLNIDAIGGWLEEAHDIQRATFQSVVKGAYMETFK